MKRILLFLMIISLFSCFKKTEIKLIPDKYEDWKRTTLDELNYPIPGHEEHYRKIYINPIGEGVKITNDKTLVRYEYPEGTIVLKEVFGTLKPAISDKPIMLTVMIKKRNDQNAMGGWLWVVKNPETKEETVMNTDFCINCHVVANQKHPYGDKNTGKEFRDYLFFPYNNNK